MTIQIDPETISFLSKSELRDFEPADAEVLGLLRRYGPQPATALASALGVAKGTINYRATILGRRVQTVQAPGRGNVTVYAAS